jgi:hypothetical protein
MSTDAIINRLERVRKVGPDRWMAACPNHTDKHPSLSIRQTGDGTVLIWCFGCGCGGTEVIDALGLTHDELFPPQPIGHKGAIRKPVFKSEVFDLILFECSIVHLIGCDMHSGKQISERDYQRLSESLAKLERIKEAAYGSR